MQDPKPASRLYVAATRRRTPHGDPGMPTFSCLTFAPACTFTG